MKLFSVKYVVVNTNSRSSKISTFSNIVMSCQSETDEGLWQRLKRQKVNFLVGFDEFFISMFNSTKWNFSQLLTYNVCEVSEHWTLFVIYLAAYCYYYYISLTVFFSRTTWLAGTRKVATSLNLNEARVDEVLGCIGISWTICKRSAPRSRQITTPTPHCSIITSQMLFLMPNQQRQSTGGYISRGMSGLVNWKKLGHL